MAKINKYWGYVAVGAVAAAAAGAIAALVSRRSVCEEDFEDDFEDLDDFKDDEKKEEKEAGFFEFRPVGSGMQNFPEILEASLEAGAQWVIVEQDQSNDCPPMEAVKKSRDYLKSLGW